ncbi:uncharacterized protein Pyn_04491 [Prunus yedoensis var. nudiflora]|uniref:FYVE-type domain-containing protein n=1 Tax=Prunus yedoensis var. nudiflora TaxID=2094558 RepID=A0A314ZV80_PRUYE|nr:uncharacterized protein Pyn_04491 [Prunus yedoensis var. nudiflora]
MLEKIGLPGKPSLRGNTWVVDASHCQGCTSQFTFINRKPHCRRCGGLFCNSCTQQRMFLRGQGDSPERICEPCEKLEEAARFKRHGPKSTAGRGSLKLTSKPEDEVLNQIIGNDRKESGQESNSNVVASKQRASSSASVQIVNKISATMGWEKYIEVFLLMSLIIYRVVMDLLLLRSCVSKLWMRRRSYKFWKDKEGLRKH